MKYNKDDRLIDIFYKNFIGGIGWVAGMTIGFTLLVSFLSFILNQLGGLPVIGEFFANIVVATQKALEASSFLK